jgi:hypothetical protein
MPWQSFSVDQYEVYQVALNTSGFTDIYGYIRLYWGGQYRATLWFYRDSAASVPANASFTSNGVVIYYARFRQAELRDAVDLLRNEKPVFFQFNDTSAGAFLTTGSEPVGEGEAPAP